MTKTKKILIVEDEQVVVNLFTRLINGLDLGLETRVAEDSESAMDFLNRGDNDLMLLDYNLKDGPTGELVARAAHGLGVPFIFTSDQTAIYDKIQKYGAIIHLPKPLRTFDVVDEVKKFYSS